MTDYFDKFRAQIAHALTMPEEVRWDTLESLDEELVRDVSICAQWPGLPEEYARAVHRVVLTCSWAGNSMLAGVKDHGPADADDYARRLQDLERDMHTVFHGVGTWARTCEAGEAFGDDPRRPLMNHLALAEDAREKIGRETGLLLTREELRQKRLAMGWSEEEA